MLKLFIVLIIDYVKLNIIMTLFIKKMNILLCDDFKLFYFILIIAFYSTFSYKFENVLIDFKTYIIIDQIVILI